MSTFTSNTYSGRYLQLTITESIDAIGNFSTLTWTLKSTGGSDSYYSIAPTTVKINGVTVYSKGSTPWTSSEFPAAKGSVSGTIKVAHEPDGSKKDVVIVFDTRVYYSTANSYGGSINLTQIDRSAPIITLTTSSLGATSVILNATSDLSIDIWEYSIDGGLTWVDSVVSESTSLSKKVVDLLPNTAYDVQVRARRKYNQVYGISEKISITTIGNTLLNSVNTVMIDSKNPIITMNWTVHDVSYSHTLVIKDETAPILTLTGLTCSVGTNNKTVSLNEEQRTTLLEYMVDKKSFSATFSLSTYDSDEMQVGNTIDKTAIIQTTPEISSPDFSEFSHRDSNDLTNNITSNNQIYIKGYSRLSITIENATAKNESIISSYVVTVGQDRKTFTSPDIDFGVVNLSGNVTLQVEVVDSRGYTTVVTEVIKVIDYTDISIEEYTIRRKNEVEPTAQLTFLGDMSPINIEDASLNYIVSAEFRYTKSGDNWSDWYGLNDINDNTYSFSYATTGLSNNGELIEFDSDYQYNIELKVTDRLSSDVISLILNKGTPLVAYRSKKIGINNAHPQSALDVIGEITQNGERILGMVGEIDSDFNTYTTGGMYWKNAEITVENSPSSDEGFLLVMSFKNNIVQLFLNGDNLSIRYYNTEEWTQWIQK